MINMCLTTCTKQKSLESSQRNTGHKDIINTIEHWISKPPKNKKLGASSSINLMGVEAPEPLVVRATGRIASFAERRELYLADYIWDLPCLALRCQHLLMSMEARQKHAWISMPANQSIHNCQCHLWPPGSRMNTPRPRDSTSKHLHHKPHVSNSNVTTKDTRRTCCIGIISTR